MNEKELGEALLKWDAAGSRPDDPRQLTEKVLSRDRRRVRMLTACVIGLWLATIAGIFLHFVVFAHIIDPKLVQRLQDSSAATDDLPQRVHEAYVLLHAIAKESVVLVSGILLAVVLAGISSVILIFASRKSTLRRVNANLMEISEQVRRLREAA